MSQRDAILDRAPVSPGDGPKVTALQRDFADDSDAVANRDTKRRTHEVNLEDSLERISVAASSPDAKRAFTFAEAAAYLGGTSWAIRRLVWAGRLPYVKVGKRFTIPREALDNFIDANLKTNGVGKLKRAA